MALREDKGKTATRASPLLKNVHAVQDWSREASETRALGYSLVRGKAARMKDAKNCRLEVGGTKGQGRDFNAKEA